MGMYAMRQETRYVSAADTGKLIRAALKSAFPGVVFGVTTKTYSGGASARVRWIDGPTQKEVDAATCQYAGATFDGSIDLQSDVYHTVDGVRTNYGTDYIFTERRFSRCFLQEATDRVCAEWGISPVPEVGWSDTFGANVQALDRIYPEGSKGDYYRKLSMLVSRAVEARD